MYQITIVFDDMGRPRNEVPTRLHHKPSGQDRVVWNGQTFYLGKHDSPEAVAEYMRIVSAIASTGYAVPPEESISIADLAKRYEKIIYNEYPQKSNEPKAILRALGSLVKSFGGTCASQFSPAKLMQLQQEWIKEGLSVSSINMKHNYILNLFRWASVLEMVKPSVWHGLQAVKKLKPQRTPAKQPKKIKPVAWADVEAIKNQVSEQVWAIIQMQWLTGMRSGEVLGMTPAQITEWVYRPVSHKNAWRGHVREVHIGPQARIILEPFLKAVGPNDRIFPDYRNDSYGRAIQRACKRAGVPHWHPHQLRHAAATRIRESFGLDGSQVVLGHACAKTTEIYAEKSATLAKKIVEELG